MTKLKSIQALRGIAALAVFFCHLFAIEEAHAGRDAKLTDLWINGAHGVDLFFVISGFIMVWVAADVGRGFGAAGTFLYSRVTRIYPLWWLFAGAMALFLLFFKGVPWDAARLDPKELDGTVHLIKSFLLWPQPEHPVLGVGWTLVHEMYFYVGFAALILLLPARWRIFGILAWGAAVLFGALSGWSNTFGNNLIELIFYPMTLQFMAGALVGYAIKAGWTRHALLFTALGIGGLLIAFFELDRPTIASLLSALGSEQPQLISPWRRTLLYGLSSAALIYGLVAMEAHRNLGRLIPKFMVDLGDWSYSLYLCHVLVISGVGRITYGVIDPDMFGAPLIYLGLVTAATLTTSALTYHFFERPSIRFFRQWRPKPEPSRAEHVSATV